MKTFLRKAIIAVAAMIASVNVMAQSFELKKELTGGLRNFEYVTSRLTKDGNPRLLSIEKNQGSDDVNGNYVSRNVLSRLSVLNNNLETEKEFTSGPLFEEYADVVVEYAAKTLKVDSVVKSRYSDINYFYRYFRFDTVEVEVYYDENDTLYYESYISYDYEEAVANLPEEVLKPYLEKYAAEYYGDSCKTTYNGYNVYFYDYSLLTSEFFDWGKQYPSEGWIYKAYNDIEYVEFYYSPDELVEINRYESEVVSAYFVDYASWWELGYESDCAATISQTLFNDDEEYEFILPVMGLITESYYFEHEHIQRTYYRYKTIGYKIVSEDGRILQEIIVNEARDNNVNTDACVMQFGDNTYLIIVKMCGDYYDEDNDGDMTYFYEINKNTNSIQKVREMQGSMRVNPTVADRNEEITISIDDDNNNVERELIITGVNGKLIERRTIPAGENTFKVNAAMMRSGMYNFTLQKKGNVVDNSKVIVK